MLSTACMCMCSLSRVQLFATPWTVPSRLLCPWDSPGKSTRGGCHFLLQGIFPTQGSLASLALAGRFFTAPWATWEALYERKTCDFLSGQVPTHCRAPGLSSGFFKFLRPPTLGLGIPPQRPQTLWFCSCSKYYLLLIYYCPHQWHKHPLSRSWLYGCRLSATCDLTGLVPCHVEMSLGRQCIWFPGKDLGT